MRSLRSWSCPGNPTTGFSATRLFLATGRNRLDMRINLDRRTDSGSRRRMVSLLEQHLFEPRQEQQHVLGLAAVAHQPDAPDFSAERTNAPGNLDAEFVQQLLTKPRLFDSRRDAHAGDRRQGVVRIGHEKLEPQSLESRDERLLILAVPLPTSRKAFLRDDAQRFAKRENQ